MLCQKWKIAARRAHWVLDRLHQLSRLNSLLVIESWWFSAAPLVMWLLLEHREPQSLVSFKSLQSRQMCREKNDLQHILCDCDNKQQQYTCWEPIFKLFCFILHRDKAAWNWSQLKQKPNNPHSGSLGPAYTERQRQCCNGTSNTSLIENNRVVPKWVETFWIHLHRPSAPIQCQPCDDASDTSVIENYWVFPKWF